MFIHALLICNFSADSQSPTLSPFCHNRPSELFCFFLIHFFMRFSFGGNNALIIRNKSFSISTTTIGTNANPMTIAHCKIPKCAVLNTCRQWRNKITLACNAIHASAAITSLRFLNTPIWKIECSDRMLNACSNLRQAEYSKGHCSSNERFCACSVKEYTANGKCQQ